MEPIIGISCRSIIDYHGDPPLVGVRRGYVDAIADAGGVPLLLPPGMDEPVLRRMYDTLDGVLLSGGADIDPTLYGEDHHPNLGPLAPERDTSEAALVRWALAEGKPLFAICRGMQLLNVVLGGTLYQDLPSQRPTPLNHDIGSRDHRWDRLDHSISIEADSRLAKYLQTTEVGINSLHHQAIKTVAPQLRVVAQAPDSVVEAVEGTNGAFVLGVQCHPEQLWDNTDPRWRNVFRAFVEAAATYPKRQCAVEVFA